MLDLTQGTASIGGFRRAGIRNASCKRCDICIKTLKSDN